MNSNLAAKAQRVFAVVAATSEPRAEVKFALAAKLPELLGSISCDDHFAYLCYITRVGDLEAARIAKERNLLTNANVGEVLVRLMSHIAGSRASYEDLMVDWSEGPRYCDGAEEQRRFVALVEWLIASFEFTPEAARKIVNAHTAEFPTPLPLLAAQPKAAPKAWSPA